MNDSIAARPPAGFAPVAAPDAPAAGSDPTRRWAIRFPDGRARLAGVTRTEADRLVSLVAGQPPAAWDDLLAEVALPVLLSDGAGPHLLDDAGRLVLVLAPHGILGGVSVAMGEPAPDHRVGVVERLTSDPLWRWRASARVGADRRVACLDALAAVAADDGLAEWARRWAGVNASRDGR